MSIWRIVSAILRFAIGGMLAGFGVGLLQDSPWVPVVAAAAVFQSPFGPLFWAVASAAAGVALMLHALPSPWAGDRRKARLPRPDALGADTVAPAPATMPTASPVPAARPVTPPAFMAPAHSPVAASPVAASPVSPSHRPAPAAPVFRSRPSGRRITRSLVIGPAR